MNSELTGQLQPDSVRTIVIDTNQIWNLPLELSRSGAAPDAEGISIPALVLAELLLPGNPKPRLKLLEFKTRVGFAPFEIMEQLARFQVSEIVSFKPFRSTQSPYQDQIASILCDPTLDKQWAVDCKKGNRQFGGRMQLRSRSFRKLINDMVAKRVLPEAPKFSDFETLMNYPGMSAGASSFLGSLVTNPISENGQRAVTVAGPEELYRAVMQNPYLSRYFKTILYYTISYSRDWDHTHQAHNFDPDEKRDDWTDITIPLYASSGDLIVTEDKKLKGAVAMVDSTGEVRTASARDL